MKKRLIFFISLVCLASNTMFCQTTGTWGDQGNGSYINPVLNADYSDPDVIQVSGKYYMVCSEFHFMGMNIQESEDMINWKIIGRVYDRLNFPAYNSQKRYGGGSWAPSIRYYNNRFWIYFCTPNEGLFMTNARMPAGPWSPLVQVKNIEGWEDPCPFWDEDGQAYLGHSVLGAGPIIIHKMSPDGSGLLDEGKTVYTGPVAEGTKIYKRNGYYYLSIPEGGVGEGWQTVLRSKNIYGPYEKKIVLETGMTHINGPHQGAMVETPKGDWWFYHFQAAGAIGRVVHLQPMYWQDDWPVIGVDLDRNGIGEPVYVWMKPDTEANSCIAAPQTDDEFNSPEPGLQWQWNHNPADNQFSLNERKGYLCLKALQASNLKEARNTLTQKVMGNTGEVIIQMNVSQMVPGQKAGLCNMSDIFTGAGVVNKGNKLFVFFDANGKSYTEIDMKKKTIFLKLVLNLVTQKNQFYYSFGNKTYKPIGNSFEASFGHWKGTRVGLFSYNEINDGGYALFDFFHYNYDGPKMKANQAKSIDNLQ